MMKNRLKAILGALIRSNWQRKMLPIFLIFAATALRALRHYGFISFPPNFAPITAIALFGGVYIMDKRAAIIIPLAAMVISDFFIGYYNIYVLISVYGSFALTGVLGLVLRNKKYPSRVIASTLGASVLFFVITNAAVWLFTPMYQLNFAGLISSYVSALPFFKWTLLGNLFYVGVLFGAYECILLWTSFRMKKKRTMAI
jgi:hypothetical protein